MNTQTSLTINVYTVTDLNTSKTYRLAARNSSEALSIAKYKYTVMFAEVEAFKHNINRYNQVRDVC